MIIAGVVIIILSIIGLTVYLILRSRMERRLDCVFGKGNRPPLPYSFDYDCNRIKIHLANGKAKLKGRFGKGITKDGTYDYNEITFDYCAVYEGTNIVYLERDWNIFVKFSHTAKEAIGIDKTEENKLNTYFEQIDNFQRIKYLGEEEKTNNRRTKKKSTTT